MIEGVGYSGAWTADSSTFLYTVPDESWRHGRVRAHRLGADVAGDRDVVVEDDRRFEVTVRLTRSAQAILVHSESRETSEVWYVDPADPALSPRSLGGRRPGVIYNADHVRDGSFLLVTNDDAVEFRLMACPVPGAEGPGPRGLARGPSGGPRRTAAPRGRLRRPRGDVLPPSAATTRCASWTRRTWPGRAPW